MKQLHVKTRTSSVASVSSTQETEGDTKESTPGRNLSNVNSVESVLVKRDT